MGVHRSREREREKAVWHLYDSMLIFCAFFAIENRFWGKGGLTLENVKGVFLGSRSYDQNCRPTRALLKSVS